MTMPLRKPCKAPSLTYTEFIVLNSTKTRDSLLVLHCLSRELGRRSFLTGTGRGGSMALFQPMNILEGEIQENRRSDLWRIKNISSVHPLGNIRASMSKNAISMFMSEVLYRTLRDGSYDDGLYEWCRNSVLALDALPDSYSNFHLRFLLELAVALGFSPRSEDLVPFAGTHIEEMNALATRDFASSMLLPLNGRARNEIADALIRYLSCHLDYPVTVRSLAVLRELFG